MSKMLKKIQADPRVSDAYKDSDGIWVRLKAGWCCAPATHILHEYTVRDTLRAMARDIESCRCDECKATSAFLNA